MRLRIPLLALPAMLLLGGCEFIHPPTALEWEQRPVVLHSILTAGAEEAAVLITRVGPHREPVIGRSYPLDPGISPVSGATVRLIAGTDSLHLPERTDGLRACFAGSTAEGPLGCYAAQVPGGIRSGTDYRLEVRLPDGTWIEGVAVPPAPVVVREPSPNARVLLDPQPSSGSPPGRVAVDLEIPPGVAGVGLALEPGAAFLGGAPAPEVRCFVGFLEYLQPVTTVAVPPLSIYEFGCQQEVAGSWTRVQPDSVHARLYVTAYDSTFMRYRSAVQSEQVRPEEAAQGITGALGLFAGAATAERRITLVPID